MSLKSRKEMDVDFMWDLSHIFKSREDWRQAYDEASEGIKEMEKLQGNLAGSAKTLKSGLDKIYKLSQKVELVYLYAFLHTASDNSDPEYQDMEGRAVQLYVAFSSAISFMRPEILSLGENVLNDYSAESELSLYRHILHDISRARLHTLSPEGERMLAMLGEASSIPSDTFDMLESVDMSFPETIDENGKKVPLTHGNFKRFLDSTDIDVRRTAYEIYFGEFKKYRNTFASLYGGSVKFDTYFAEIRNFSSACESALFSSNIPVSVYDSLVEAVHSSLPEMKKYIELRKKALKLDKIEMYDLYCPIVQDANDKYTFRDACELVKKALEPLGEAYSALLDRAIGERWIDVYENKGKTTGAFSCGVYGVHPYVLLNFNSSLDDVFTIAHELGHAMHSYLSSAEQEYANHDYKIMVAEVASTVNEILLTKYLLKIETQPNRKAYILNHYLEGFRTTVFRQTLFAEFERKAHDIYKSGTPLTADVLDSLYRELNLLYYDGVNVGELHNIEWARIPHFYNSFYVYQYATGFCSAAAIAEQIIENGSADGYIDFLKTGGSDYPLNELLLTGVDLSSPKPVSEALQVFGKCVEELSDILS